MTNSWCLYVCHELYLQSHLLVESYRSVAEGDAVTEAGLPFDRPLGHVHDDLGPLSTGVEQEGEGREANTALLDGQAALWLVLAALGSGRKSAA